MLKLPSRPCARVRQLLLRRVRSNPFLEPSQAQACQEKGASSVVVSGSVLPSRRLLRRSRLVSTLPCRQASTPLRRKREPPQALHSRPSLLLLQLRATTIRKLLARLRPPLVPTTQPATPGMATARSTQSSLASPSTACPSTLTPSTCLALPLATCELSTLSGLVPSTELLLAETPWFMRSSLSAMLSAPVSRPTSCTATSVANTTSFVSARHLASTLQSCSCLTVGSRAWYRHDCSLILADLHLQTAAGAASASLDPLPRRPKFRASRPTRFGCMAG